MVSSCAVIQSTMNRHATSDPVRRRVWLAAAWGRHVHHATASSWFDRQTDDLKLWADDYLAAFAQTSGAALATLDSKLPSRYPSVRVESLIKPQAPDLSQ